MSWNHMIELAALVEGLFVIGLLGSIADYVRDIANSMNKEHMQ